MSWDHQRRAEFKSLLGQFWSTAQVSDQYAGVFVDVLDSFAPPIVLRALRDLASSQEVRRLPTPAQVKSRCSELRGPARPVQDARDEGPTASIECWYAATLSGDVRRPGKVSEASWQRGLDYLASVMPNLRRIRDAVERERSGAAGFVEGARAAREIELRDRELEAVDEPEEARR